MITCLERTARRKRTVLANATRCCRSTSTFSIHQERRVTGHVLCGATRIAASKTHKLRLRCGFGENATSWRPSHVKHLNTRHLNSCCLMAQERSNINKYYPSSLSTISSINHRNLSLLNPTARNTTAIRILQNHSPITRQPRHVLENTLPHQSLHLPFRRSPFTPRPV